MTINDKITGATPIAESDAKSIRHNMPKLRTMHDTRSIKTHIRWVVRNVMVDSFTTKSSITTDTFQEHIIPYSNVVEL